MLENRQSQRIRLALAVLFLVIGLLTAAAWSVTGERAPFEAITAMSGVTGIVLIFGFA